MRARRWDVLKNLIKDHNVKTMVEVGVLKGENASNILEAFPDLNYIGIDPYIGSLATYDHDANKVLAQSIFDKYENAELFIGVSEDFPVDKTYDLVFIDGDHEYDGCLRDILFWKDKCKILTGHDYSKYHPGVQTAVDKVFNSVKVYEDNVWRA